MMRNGEIQPKPTESKAVQNIFQAYLNGSSLLAIANWMSSQGIPYNGIDFVWNKNMIKRILENEKYLGRNGYPAIIDENMFCRANMRKKIKSTTVVEISEELQAIRSLTYCAECGHRISRIGGNTHSEKWDCRNPLCAFSVHQPSHPLKALRPLPGVFRIADQLLADCMRRIVLFSHIPRID